jgi:O-antigen biosynthesis alpha-1,2-rhamnosyltransferase
MIYIDITDTIKIPYITGIQRVVRNIIIFSLDNELVAFVEFDKDLKKYVVINKTDKRFSAIITGKIENYKKPEIIYKFIKSRFPKEIKELIIKFLIKMIAFKKKVSIASIFHPKALLLDKVKKDDLLLLADSTWNYKPWLEVSEAKNRGVKIMQIAYDILPIKYPHFFQENTNSNFNLWFKMINYYCDELYAISHTTANNIFEEIRDNNFKPEIKIMEMGNDIEFHNPNHEDSTELTDKTKFLTVGTIEPRKNHIYVLKVFDKLWSEGVENIEWHIAGREGWFSNNFIMILKYHPRINKNLFFHENLNDNDLRKLYQKSDCVIIPSIDEGYGLQVAEGLNYNCKILLSNIEIFREFNLNENNYFSINDKGSELRSKITQYVNGENFDVQVNNANILSWRDAVEDLITTLEK